MAVSKDIFRPMEVYWTRDSDSDGEGHGQDLGLFSAGNRRPRRPKVSGKKTNEVKPAVPIKQPLVQNLSPDKSNATLAATKPLMEDAPPRKAALKDLCAEDKKRVANLIKELARAGEEKEQVVHQLEDERSQFESQLREVCEQQEAILSEREGVQKQLVECQRLLVQYQACLSDQQHETQGKEVSDGAERRAEMYTPEKARSEPRTQHTPLPRPDPQVIARAEDQGHRGNKFGEMVQSSPPADQGDSPVRPFTQMIDQMIASERGVTDQEEPNHHDWTTPQAVQEKLFGMGPLQAPVLSSTQNSEYVPPKHGPTEAVHQQFQPLPRDPHPLISDHHIPIPDHNKPSSHMYSPAHPQRKSPMLLYSLDDDQFLEYYSRLGPEERRHQVALQREALLDEQERLRAILAEQESLLRSKQEVLHNQQQLHLQRLKHFEETGTFPMHNIAKAYLANGMGKHERQSNEEVVSSHGRPQQHQHQVSSGPVRDEEQTYTPHSPAATDLSTQPGHTGIPHRSQTHADSYKTQPRAEPNAVKKTRSAATSPTRPMATQSVSTATSPIRPPPSTATTSPPQPHRNRSTTEGRRAPSKGSRRSTRRDSNRDFDTEQLLELMASFEQSPVVNQPKKNKPKSSARKAQSKPLREAKSSTKMNGSSRGRSSMESRHATRQMNKATSVPVLPPHRRAVSQSDSDEDEDLEESQILEDIFFV